MASKNGFTLIELAIALMVIGLLIGGVLKGQELIENARMIRTIKDVNDFDTAVMIFRNTYNGIPGDLRRAERRLPNCNAAPCNNTVGIGNGRIDTEIKSMNFWVHLGHAGLVTGLQDEATADFTNISPTNAFGGHFIMYYTSQFIPLRPNERERHFYSFALSPSGSFRIDAATAARFDMKGDDGKPLTGSILIHENLSAMDQCYDPATEEYLNDASLQCQILQTSSSLD